MRKFILVVREEEESYKFTSKNDGFNSFEVLGILASKVEDIKEQLKGAIRPVEYDRRYVKPEEDKPNV